MMYKVTRQTISLKQEQACRHNWPLSVTVEALEEGADPNVFVYHADTDPESGQGDTFSNVASKQDMDTIPVGEPVFLPEEHSQENFIPFYRTNTAEFDCYNTTELLRIWKIIQLDIAALVREYEAWNTLNEGQQETVEI